MGPGPEKAHLAAPCCQAAALSLTARRLPGLKWTSPGDGPTSRRCLAAASGLLLAHPEESDSGSPWSMASLGGLEGGTLVFLPLGPQGKDDPAPDVRQRAHRHTVTFPRLALALIVVACPYLRQGTLPGKLLHGIPQGLDTSIAPMRLGILAAFRGHRRGARQSLQTRGVPVTLAIISQFGQQSRSQSLARARQAPDQATVSVGQKKAFNLL